MECRHRLLETDDLNSGRQNLTNAAPSWEVYTDNRKLGQSFNSALATASRKGCIVQQVVTREQHVQRTICAKLLFLLTSLRLT